MKERVFTILASLLVISTQSLHNEERFYVRGICSLREEILQRCNSFNIQTLDCQNNIKDSECRLECSSALESVDDYLVILSRKSLYYYCNVITNPDPTSPITSIKLYKLEHFNCNLLSNPNYSNSIPKPCLSKSIQLSQRRLQTSCRISLNFDSISQKSLSSRTPLLHITNKCNRELSWLCKDSSSTLDILQASLNIQFSKSSSDSYLSAEYDVGLERDSYTMEVLSLFQGGVRRECWANKLFEGVPIFTEFTDLLFVSHSYLLVSRYYSGNPSCRVIGYYKAKSTGSATVQFSVDGTATGWVFTDQIEPNFPNIKGSQLYQTTIDLVKDQFYFLRFDIVFLTAGSGLYTFNLAYEGLSNTSPANSDIYYPVRTDYSPLDLNSLPCNEDYFLPVPETNGDIICPSELPDCKKITFEKRIADESMNPFCELYRWENDIQICEKCKTSSVLNDGVCICTENSYLDNTQSACLNSNVITITVFLYQKFNFASLRVILIISNPCIVSQTWTCEPTGESNLLSSSIFKYLPMIGPTSYLIRDYLHRYSKYSFHFNVLTQNKFQFTCWSNSNFTGDVLISEGRAYSNQYLSIYRSCRWEGFIYGLPAGDYEFSIFSYTSTQTNAKLWIKNDSVPVINYACCDTVNYRIRIAKELYYYFRLDLYHTSNPLSIVLKYKLLPDGAVLDIPTNTMFQPIRLGMGVLTGTPEITYPVDIITPDRGIIYCPVQCTSCIFSFIDSICTSCIEGAILVDKKCQCLANRVHNSMENTCERFFPLSTTCGYTYNNMTCSKCVVNASVVDDKCECSTLHYEDGTTNSCKPNPCRISLSLTKESQYNYVDTLLEISSPCQSTNSILCQTSSSNSILRIRKLVKFTNNPPLISAGQNISPSSAYTISLIHLKAGSFILETFPSSDWTGTPVTSISSSEFSLSDSQGKSYRLQGYIKFRVSAIYKLVINLNSIAWIYFDFLDYPWKYPDTINVRWFYFYGEKYYYIRIDFIGITTGTLNFKLYNVINETMYLPLTSEFMYYADHSSISRWDISSCDSTLYTTSIQNGLRYCSELCTSCYLRVNQTGLDSDEVCDGCMDNAEVGVYNKCECKTGYYIYLDSSSSCRKCPDTCMSCSMLEGKVICDSCIENGIIESGECVCKTGYYFNTDPNISCSKCPDTCKMCSQGENSVICDSCILNAYIESGECICNPGYIYNSLYEDSCYNPYEFCIQLEYINDTIVCKSCVENAQIEGVRCICIEGYYGSLSQEDVCDRCPSTCRKCKKESSEVICEACIERHYVSIRSPGYCLECSEYCNRCEEIEGNEICIECLDTFKLVYGKCFCDFEDSFISDNKCKTKDFKLNYSSDTNTITLYFSKRLLAGLDSTYITIQYPDTIDSSLITYTIQTIEEYYSYSLIFQYSQNIDENIIISVHFSDYITDRQHINLKINPVYMNLILYNYHDNIQISCEDLCEECYIDICIQCKDYAYLDDVICRCYSGRGYNNTCRAECPEGMQVDYDSKRCIFYSEPDTPNNSTGSNHNEENNTTSTYSDPEIEQAEYYYQVSSNTSNIACLFSLILGFITSCLDKAWSLMNTIQIFAYLPLISIDIPLSLRRSLIAQDNSHIISGLFKNHLPKGPATYKEAYEAGFESGLYLNNSAKNILILMIILCSNLVIYSTYRLSKGKIKDLTGKVLSNFYYGVYLRYFIQVYMDLAIHTLIQTLTVIII